MTTSSSTSSNEKRNYKQATGRFELSCTFDAVFPKASPDNKERDLKLAKILKALVSNARTKRDPKYQTIGLENPNIQEYVVSNEAAMDLLKTVGFVRVLSPDGTSESLVYTPTGMNHFQFGSRLESLLEEKIVQLQKKDTSTTTQKKQKETAKTRKKNATQDRKQQVMLYKEDRELQQMFKK